MFAFARKWDMTSKLLVSIVVVMCILRLGLFWINTAYSWDELAYMGLASGLLHDLPYGQITANFGEAAYRPPLLPVTLLGIFSVTGFSETAAKFLTPLLSVVSIVIVYFLGREIGGKEVGIVAAALLAFNPTHLFFSFRVLAENYFGLLFAADLLLLLQARRNPRWLVALGATAALTALVRYSGAAFVVAAFIALLVFDRRWLTEQLQQRWFWLGAVIFVLTLAPWLIYNVQTYGNPLGAALTFAAASQVNPFPGHYLLLWPLLVGFAAPLALYGLWKVKDSRPMLIIAAITGLMLLAHEVDFTDLRYATFSMPAFALLAAHGWRALKSRRWISPILLVIILFNAAFGFYMVSSFAYPTESRNALTPIIELGGDQLGGRLRAYDEHISYKQAALALASAAAPGDTVTSNGCLFVWFYTGLTCYYYENNASANWAYHIGNGPAPIGQVVYTNTYTKIVALGH
jgi:4-amino-4-deoxy-L-arabinose transferase-like glycosyltransferase